MRKSLRLKQSVFEEIASQSIAMTIKQQTKQKRLVKGEKKIFGVCSGLANYFDLDPTLVRVGFLLLFFGFGTGLLLYIILAFVMPSE